MTARSAQMLRRSKDSPEAFADFYRMHSEDLLGYMMRRVYDADVAFDLTAETFAQAYVGRRRFKGSTEDEAMAWLYQIARRQIAAFCKRARVEGRALQRLKIELPQLDDEWRERIEKMAAISDVRQVLQGELAQLSGAQREAVLLRVVDELPYAAVAQRLRISEGAARVRVTRGLSTLAEALEGHALIMEVKS